MIDKRFKKGYDYKGFQSKIGFQLNNFGQLTQLGEYHLDMVEATGSSPVLPTKLW